MWDRPPVYGDNTLLRFIWDSMRGKHLAQACVAPDAFYVACMNKASANIGSDRFSAPDVVLSVPEQDALALAAGPSPTFTLDNGLVINTFDPSSTTIGSAKYQRLIEVLKPLHYGDNFACGHRDLHVNVFGGALTSKDYMRSYREFVGAKDPKAQIGYGVRLGTHLCKWVPKLCESADPFKRPVIDLGEDRDGWKAAGSRLEQPPWNDWPNELTDQILSDVMFSLQGMLVQSVQGFTDVGWESELSNASKACAETHGGVYVLPTGWMSAATVRPGFLPYGVDMFFGRRRELVAMFDETAEAGAPSCWAPPAGADDGPAARKWSELKLLGMAGVLSLQPYMYHAVEKVAVGGVMWSAIYTLPAGHPIRNIMMPFGHRSLEKANQIYDVAFEEGEFFRMQTGLTVEGWKLVTQKALALASRFDYPTGNMPYWKARSLEETKMPFVVFGSQVREAQAEFMRSALDAHGVTGNPLNDDATRALAEQVRKQWNLTAAEVPLDTRDDLAWFLSELLFRMSVSHTNTHHHPICHATMANSKIFPFQLVRGPNGDVFPTSDHHVASMVIWDMGTEPMPHMDYPLADNGAFRLADGVASANATRLVEEAYKVYQERLAQIEEDVHEYNRDRCKDGDYATATGCLPYSCMIPRELLMSYGI